MPDLSRRKERPDHDGADRRDAGADPEVEKSLSLAGVFDWYQDCPEQIDRAVIIGGGGEHRANLINKRCEYEQNESL
jgi:hypothetical protein